MKRYPKASYNMSTYTMCMLISLQVTLEINTNPKKEVVVSESSRDQTSQKKESNEDDGKWSKNRKPAVDIGANPEL